MKRVLLAVRRKCGLTLRQVAAECRKISGGEGMGTTVLCAYFNGTRPIGDIHFQILCKVLRVLPEDVYIHRYLVRGRPDGSDACS